MREFCVEVNAREFIKALLESLKRCDQSLELFGINRSRFSFCYAAHERGPFRRMSLLCPVRGGNRGPGPFV